MGSWREEEEREIYNMKLNDMIFREKGMKRENFDKKRIKIRKIIKIKKGGWKEDWGYWRKYDYEENGMKE